MLSSRLTEGNDTPSVPTVSLGQSGVRIRRVLNGLRLELLERLCKGNLWVGCEDRQQVSRGTPSGNFIDDAVGSEALEGPARNDA
jgi:hypothetical protein